MSISAMKIVQTAIIAAPAEFTTIAGAKVKDNVAEVLDVKHEKDMNASRYVGERRGQGGGKDEDHAFLSLFLSIFHALASHINM